MTGIDEASMRAQHTSVLGPIQRAVFEVLPPASRAGHGVTVREVAERTGFSERQVRDALTRLNRQRRAFRFDTDERNAGLWERARSGISGGNE